MRPGELVGGGVRDVRPEKRLDGLRRRDRGRPREPVRVGQHERADAAHQLGPVEEREALLRLQREGLEPRLEARLEPLVLEAKEGLALLNGTQLMTAIGALVLADADRLARTASVAAARRRSSGRTSRMPPPTS